LAGKASGGSIHIPKGSVKGQGEAIKELKKTY